MSKSLNPYDITVIRGAGAGPADTFYDDLPGDSDISKDDNPNDTDGA